MDIACLVEVGDTARLDAEVADDRLCRAIDREDHDDNTGHTHLTPRKEDVRPECRETIAVHDECLDRHRARQEACRILGHVRDRTDTDGRDLLGTILRASDTQVPLRREDGDDRIDRSATDDDGMIPTLRCGMIAWDEVCISYGEGMEIAGGDLDDIEVGCPVGHTLGGDREGLDLDTALDEVLDDLDLNILRAEERMCTQAWGERPSDVDRPQLDMWEDECDRVYDRRIVLENNPPTNPCEERYEDA